MPGELLGNGPKASARGAKAKLRAALRWSAMAVLALFALSGWLVAPAPFEPTVSPRTVATLVRAPFADRIVLGDSRAYDAPERDGLVVAAYPGVTIANMAPLARVLCWLSNGEIVIALGTNDAKTDLRRPVASLAAMRQMIEHCGPERVWVSEVWPGEPARLPAGPEFDPATIAALNQGIRQMTASGMGRLIPLPEIATHTTDGIHFDAATTARYHAMLAQAGRTNAIIPSP